MQPVRWATCSTRLSLGMSGIAAKNFLLVIVYQSVKVSGRRGPYFSGIVPWRGLPPCFLSTNLRLFFDICHFFEGFMSVKSDYVSVKLSIWSVKLARFLGRFWPWFSVDHPFPGALGAFPQTPQFPPTHPIWAGWLC